MADRASSVQRPGWTRSRFAFTVGVMAAGRRERGRGASLSPPNRFERLQVEVDEEDPEARPATRTEFLVDTTQRILSRNDSPDIGFDYSVNPYRGCEHGCAYCYARPTHEFLGFNSGIDFESRIMVKPDAAKLLRKELENPRWKPQVVAMSGVTDCYQPVEKRLLLTRACLEVLVDFRNPVAIVTKNHLVTRDSDLLGELAKFEAAAVYVSITSLDPGLVRSLEPRSSLPAMRLDAVRRLSEAGVPVGVIVAPTIPGLNDQEIPAILSAAADAGAVSAAYTILRLPYAVKDIFRAWLEEHFPDRKEKVLSRLRSLRGGKLNVSNFGTRMRGEGIWADQIRQLFQVSSRKAGLPKREMRLSSTAFRKASGQLELW